MRRWWRVPYMDKRKKAIRMSIAAHKKGQYELSIPTLLPLIDGISALVMQGTLHRSGKAMFVKEAAAVYREEQDFESAGECVETVVTALMYKDYDFGSKAPSNVNRHGILHGRIARYATE